MKKRKGTQEAPVDWGRFGVTGGRRRVARKTLEEEAVAGLDTSYATWQAGTYPQQSQFPNLHGFLCHQGTLRRFANHQAMNNAKLVSALKAFDLLCREDDSKAAADRKTWGDLVKESLAVAEREPTPVALPSLPIASQQAPLLSADLSIVEAVEHAMHQEEQTELSTSVTEAMIQELTTEGRQRAPHSCTANRTDTPVLYPALHKHEVYGFAERVLVPRAYAPAPDTAETLQFPLPSELPLLPEDVQSNARIMQMLRTTHQWARPTTQGLVCRSCWGAAASGAFTGRALPWKDVNMRLTSRGKEHTDGVRSSHTRKWTTWLEGEGRRVQFGAAGELRVTAQRQSWINAQVTSLFNTQMLVHLFHDLQFCCKYNRPLTTTPREIRERDGYFSPESKRFTASYFNLTSSTIVNEALHIMATVIRRQMQAKIAQSPFCAVLTDETQDATKLSQHATLIRVIDPTTFETQELLWSIAPLRDSQNAANICSFLLEQTEHLGESFWNRVVSFASDGCNTMGGGKSGVQLRVKIAKCPYALWASCRSHALNLVAQHVVRRHPVIQECYNTIAETYACLYRGHSASKLRVFAECQEACRRVDGFSYWRQRELCAVSDTRWCSHERCATTLTTCLRGVVMCMAKLDSEKAIALRSKYASAANCIGLFLISEVMGMMGAFSRCLQSPALCFADISLLAVHYATQLGKLMEHPDLFVRYIGCWVLVNDARPGTEPITELHVTEYHQQYAVPFLQELKKEVEERMDEFEVLSSFGIYDPRSRDFNKLNLSKTRLSRITTHYCEAKKFSLLQEDGSMRETEESIPYFTSQDKAEIEAELEGALQAIAKDTQTEAKKKGASFASIIRTFLRVDVNRIAYPQTCRLLLLALAVPLTTAGVERLFSKLRIVKNRLSSCLGDTKLNDMMVVSAEGELTADGIPPDVLEQYIEAYVSENRRLQYAPFRMLREAQQWVTNDRASHEKSWWI